MTIDWRTFMQMIVWFISRIYMKLTLSQLTWLFQCSEFNFYQIKSMLQAIFKSPYFSETMNLLWRWLRCVSWISILLYHQLSHTSLRLLSHLGDGLAGSQIYKESFPCHCSLFFYKYDWISCFLEGKSRDQVEYMKLSLYEY